MFNNKKGFGFIRPTDGTEKDELFAHYSQIEEADNKGYKSLNKDDEVQFVATTDKKGRKMAGSIIVTKAAVETAPVGKSKKTDK